MFQSQPLLIFIALTTIALVVFLLYWRRSAPLEILFSMALGLFVLSGVIAPEQAWQSFSNGTVIAIGSLLVVTAGLRTTGALDQVGRVLLGTAKSEKSVLLRLSAAVTGASAFLLNTAIVAMLLPQVITWCRQHNIAPSRLLLPISYMAILGGTCTLVGTSTNLLVNEHLQQLHAEVTTAISEDGLSLNETSSLREYDPQWILTHTKSFAPMQMTEISKVGVPCAIVGAILLLLFGNRLLPDRTEMLESLEEQRREYLVELLVLADCPLIGRTVEEGGLRHLPGLFLIEIDREGDIIGPVSPRDRIQLGDRLVFTGIVSTIVDLEKIPGLVPAADLSYDLHSSKNSSRSLVEVVLSPSSPLVGTTVRKADFRRLYGAAVVAVHRNGKRLPTKIGDIELEAGDTLLLQAQPGFIRNFRNRPDFYLVSDVGEGETRRPLKMRTACLITASLVAWLLAMPLLPSLLAPIYGTTEIPKLWNSPSAAIFLAALGMVATGCLPTKEVRNALDLPLLLTIGAAIGVGRAIHLCGAADWVASLLVESVGGNPYVGLVVVFLITVGFTEVISNVAVAALMISIAIGLANSLGVDPRPFIMAVTFGASLSFLSPIGYQTNLMVMGPGGYRPVDYFRAGLPLSLVIGSLALILIPRIWPF